MEFDFWFCLTLLQPIFHKYSEKKKCKEQLMCAEAISTSLVKYAQLFQYEAKKVSFDGIFSFSFFRESLWDGVLIVRYNIVGW